MPKGIYERTPEQKAKLSALYRKGQVIKCPVCGAERYKPMAQIRKLKDTTGGYCSRSCRAKANAKHLLPYCANGKGKKCPAKGMKLSANPAWKGGVTFKRSKGNYIGPKYVRCPIEFLPMARKDGYVMEHRLVMARILGRLLKRQEVVHHRDHNTRNNSPNNLILFASNAKHKKHEGEELRKSGRDIVTEGKV